jgi:hypothetical protein
LEVIVLEEQVEVNKHRLHVRLYIVPSALALITLLSLLFTGYYNLIFITLGLCAPISLLFFLRHFKSFDERIVLVLALLVDLCIAVSEITRSGNVKEQLPSLWLTFILGLIIYVCLSLFFFDVRNRFTSVKLLILLLLMFSQYWFIRETYYLRVREPLFGFDAIDLPERHFCKKYQLNLSFTPSNNTFIGSQKMEVEGRLFADDIQPANGVENLSPATKEAVMAKLEEEVIQDWNIENIRIAPIDDAGDNISVMLMEALLRTDKADIKTTKKGWITYVTEVNIPRVVYRWGGDAKEELRVTLPKYARLTHNLNGTITETVLENGDVGQILVADKIADGSETIRFVHVSSFFQNPVFSFLASFSWWELTLWVIAFFIGITGYFCGVVLDVFKDESVKPYALRILIGLGLVKATTDSRANPQRRRRRIMRNTRRH